LSPTNSVIISTPHIEHWNNVKKSQHYKYIFVDKPLVTIKKDCLEYLKNSYRAICLMNRRFSSYTQEIKTLQYGSRLSNAQEVVDFILGYSQRQQAIGFSFENVISGSNVVENWPNAAKEFLFWTTQGWANSALIALSPGANLLEFKRDYHIVDNIKDAISNYEPRVKVLNVKVRAIDDENRVNITVVCKIISTSETINIDTTIERLR
jgi:hypothetical protein